MPRRMPWSGSGKVVAVTACLLIAALQAFGAELAVVVQRDRAFAVSALEIPAGTTVRFTNEDRFPHQLYTKGPGVDLESGLQRPGQDVDVAFPSAGKFEVRCGVHPKMLLTITVP